MENTFKVKTKHSNTEKNEDNDFKKERKKHNLMVKDKLKKALIRLKISEKKQKKLDKNNNWSMIIEITTISIV